MQVATFEGVVENGEIRIKPNIRLPEKTKVFVVVPNYQAQKIIRLASPRLAHPEQAADFKKEIVEVSSNGGV